MENIKEKYIDYQMFKIKEDLKNCIDLLCDLSIEPDILDIINLLESIIELRTLKKVIEKEKEV